MTFREDIRFQGCVHSCAIVDTKQLLREGQGRVLLPGHTGTLHPSREHFANLR